MKTSDCNICKTIPLYVKSMTEKELKAYHIARDHLGDSFQLEKSIGFLDWLKKQQQDLLTVHEKTSE